MCLNNCLIINEFNFTYYYLIIATLKKGYCFRKQNIIM